jgi:hypothetical protein
MARISIFVSSKTNELREERIMIKKLLESLYDGIDVFIFEDDVGARTGSTKETYVKEVMRCDIYIGLFKNEYSEATEHEYHLPKRGWVPVACQNTSLLTGVD